MKTNEYAQCHTGYDRYFGFKMIYSGQNVLLDQSTNGLTSILSPDGKVILGTIENENVSKHFRLNSAKLK